MKNKIIITSLFAVFFLISTTSFAQGSKEDRKAKREKLDSLKKDFFNSALALTDSEKTKFWPMYEEYNTKTRALQKSFRSKYKKNDIIYMDEAKAKAYLQELNAHKAKILALDKEYQTKFLSFLSAKKVVMIDRTEKEWREKMRNYLKRRMTER